MKNAKSNTELLQLLKQGDKVAFYNIYERYCKRLYGFIYRYIKQEEDTDEIVQEVFIKIWEARNKIDIYASFESFLFTIAYNTTISLLRKKLTEQKYLEHLKTITLIQNSPDVTDEIYFKELDQQIKDLLNEISPRQKEIFLLSREEGLTHNEIAEKLGISLNTVKKHISNTLSFLKSKIDTSLIINIMYISLFLS